MVRELPRVGVTEDGEVQVVRDDTGDVHVYAKSTDDVLVHRKKTDSGKVELFDFSPNMTTFAFCLTSLFFLGCSRFGCMPCSL